MYKKCDQFPLLIVRREKKEINNLTQNKALNGEKSLIIIKLNNYTLFYENNKIINNNKLFKLIKI